MILSQTVPGVDEAIKAAEIHGGYEAILIVIFFVVVLCFLIWLVRQWLADAVKREERMAKRIDDLELFIRTEMKALALECKQAFDKNSEVMTRLSQALHDRPCLAKAEA